MTTGPTARHVRALGPRLAALVVAAGLAGSGGALALTVVLSIGGPASPAAADPVAACGPGAGVVVAVDFRPFGGQVQAGCDPTTTTGLDALEVSGFTPTGTSQYGLAFMCLIDGYPLGQSCTSTPPASASWSFWLATAGADTWTYSTAGAATITPQPGSVEAWIFGSSSPANHPAFTPAQVRPSSGPSPSTTTTTTTAPQAGTAASTTTSPVGGGSTPASAPAGSRGGTSAGSPGSPDAVPVGTSTGTATTGPGATPTTGGTTGATTGGAPATGSSGHHSADPVVIVAAPATSDHHSTSGSPVPAVIAVLVLVSLGGAAGIIARRRRRAA